MAQHFTSLPERHAAQQAAHPDWTPELNDVAYVTHGTGGDRDRVWTLSEIFALFAGGSITELTINAQGGRAVLSGGKLKFETVNGSGQPTGNKVEFAYNGGISFIESGIAKASLTKQEDGSYELKLHDGMATFGDGVSTDGTTLKAVPRVLVNKKVNTYDPIERRCTLGYSYGGVAVVREVNELSGWHVEQTILTPGKLEVWSTKGNAEEDYTLHKVNQAVLQNESVDDMLSVDGTNSGKAEWMKAKYWKLGQTRKVKNVSGSSVVVPVYSEAGVSQDITFRNNRYREFICIGFASQSPGADTLTYLLPGDNY